ncbi:hypothetical protein ACIGO8_08260 [Streptomyces sp. NPDC053493]|uniref:hypothetical protein n=1 Tax=Streptomyces sp. NPDC053493 TaxID=3365705 RepID=UPI0037D7ABB0
MTDQTAACRTTRHCATHDFCHRCAPSLHKATQHLVKAIDSAGIEYSASGRVYAKLAATIRDAARQAAGQSAAGADQVRAMWPQILEAVKNRRRFTWNTLSQNAQVAGFDGTTLQLGFPDEDARAGFTDSGSEDVLTAALAEQFNVHWRIEAIIVPPGGAAATAAAGLAAGQLAAECVCDDRPEECPAVGEQPVAECPQCDDTGACNGGPCAHPAAGLAAPTNHDTEDRRRLAAVERLCSGRPGYHTVTVKQLLTAMSDAAGAES